MAYLLGSKFCVESLTSDVKDLQAAAVDAFSRVGPVRYPSWKFPDKISSDLDIDELLEDCLYSEEDEEDNQVAHIKLFEMVIDRMVLLLQSFSRFTDQMLTSTSGRPHTAGPQAVGKQMSIGLVVKKFWNKMVQLNILLQKLNSENRSKTRTLTKLENINQQLQQQTLKLTESYGILVSPQHRSPRSSVMNSITMHEMPTSTPNTDGRVSTDLRSVASQTLETSFVPCEACYQVQMSFKEVGDFAVNICKAQGLPSAIMKYRQSETGEMMTAADILRWRKEGEKDLNQIKAHLSNLMAQIKPLKTDLEDSKTNCQKLTKTLSDKTTLLQKERRDRETQVAQYEIRIKNIEKKHKESMTVVQRSYDDLVKGKTRVDQEMVTLKQELLKQHEALKELDFVKKQLQETVSENISKKNTIVRLESDVEQMTEQLRDTHDQLEDVSRKLGKEQAKNRSLEKQGQAMQVKQDILAQRVDELDQDCQELRDQLAEVEDNNEEALNDLQQAQDEIKLLQNGLQKEKELAESIQREKSFLEKSIDDLKTIILSLEDEVKVAQDRERLLVQYPERNPNLVPNPGKTGIIENDMKSQVQANNIRMQVLEEENHLLRKNISKLLDGREEKKVTSGIQINGPAIPLWQRGAMEDNRVRSTAEEKYFTEISPRTQQSHLGRNTLEPIQAGAGSCDYNHNSKGRKYEIRNTRPGSRGSPAEGNKAKRQQSSKDLSRNSSIQAYVKLKKTGSLHSGVGDTKGKHSVTEVSREKQGWTSNVRHNKRPGTGDSYSKQDMLICPACDKMYSTQRDMDIHKSYCYG